MSYGTKRKPKKPKTAHFKLAFVWNISTNTILFTIILLFYFFVSIFQGQCTLIVHKISVKCAKFNHNGQFPAVVPGQVVGISKKIPVLTLKSIEMFTISQQCFFLKKPQ